MVRRPFRSRGHTSDAREATVGPGEAIATPNGLDFVRVNAQGPATLTIELESFTPTEW